MDIFFEVLFGLEALFKMFAFGVRPYLSARNNQVLAPRASATNLYDRAKQFCECFLQNAFEFMKSAIVD